MSCQVMADMDLIIINLYQLKSEENCLHYNIPFFDSTGLQLVKNAAYDQEKLNQYLPENKPETSKVYSSIDPPGML